MENVLDNEDDIFEDPAYRMPSRPPGLREGKQFESLGNDFARNRNKPHANDGEGGNKRQDRISKRGGAGGGRVELSEATGSSCRGVRTEIEDDSDDELDTLSKRSASPPPKAEKPQSSIYAERSSALKNLKFYKRSKVSTESAPQLPSPPSSSLPKAPTKDQRLKQEPSHGDRSKSAERTPKDEGRKPTQGPPNTRYSNRQIRSARDPPAKPTRKAADSPKENMHTPKLERERPKPRRLQKPQDPPPPSDPPSRLRSNPLFNDASHPPSAVPNDSSLSISESKHGQALSRKPTAFPVSPLSTPVPTKVAPRAFPLLSPPGLPLAPTSSIASIPPSSPPPPKSRLHDPPSKRSRNKKFKSTAGVAHVNGRSRVIVTDEESDPSSDESNQPKLQPFPMSTRDLASIAQSPEPLGLGKRPSPDGHGRASGKKRREDSSPSPPWPNAHADDMETLFPSAGADPRTLCPYCDVPLPPFPTPLLLYLLSPNYAPLYSKSRRDPRPGNKLGRSAPLGAFIPVCQRHRFESEMLPQAEAQGWPKEIDWEELGRRVKRLKADMAGLLDGSISGARSRSVFWQEVMKEYKDKGSRAVTGVKGQFENFEKTQPGYYGEQGSNIIHQILFNLFPPSSIEAISVAPLSPNEFISRVLVPEVAVALIMEDQCLPDKPSAVKILRESSAYGVAMFPEDGGDWAQAEKDRLAGISSCSGTAMAKSSRAKGKARHSAKDETHFELGVADQIVMERARKRRLEVEEEMRIEDEMFEREREQMSRQMDETGEAASMENWEDEGCTRSQARDQGHLSSNFGSPRKKQRQRPVPLARKYNQPPSRSSSIASKSEHGQSESETSDTGSQYSATNPRRSSRRKGLDNAILRSPSVSDFQRFRSNEPSPVGGMDWVSEINPNPRQELDPQLKAIDLCTDDSDVPSERGRPRRKPGRKNTADRACSSRSTSTSKQPLFDATADPLWTPKPTTSRKSFQPDEDITPRQLDRTPAGSLAPSGSSVVVFPLFEAKRKVEANHLRANGQPAKLLKQDSVPWLTSMADTADDPSDNEPMNVGDGDGEQQPYGGRHAHGGPRQGLKKQSSSSWLLSSDDSQS